MGENITLEIPFNEKNERENQKFYFRYVWTKALKSWIRIIITTVVFLFLGFYPIENFDKNLMFYFFRYAGVMLFGYCFIFINQYFSSKKKFKKQIEKIIDEFKYEQKSSYIGLNHENIEFKNCFYTISSVWGKVSFIKIKNYLIINTFNNSNFIINKSEFKNDEFEIILRYLEKYAKRLK